MLEIEHILTISHCKPLNCEKKTQDFVIISTFLLFLFCACPLASANEFDTIIFCLTLLNFLLISLPTMFYFGVRNVSNLTFKNGKYKSFSLC